MILWYIIKITIIHVVIIIIIFSPFLGNDIVSTDVVGLSIM